MAAWCMSLPTAALSFAGGWQMSLSEIEKCAGRHFVVAANGYLTRAYLEFPGSADCSPRVRFFRHSCPNQQGRTHSISLREVSVSSPEIWVAWDGEGLRVVDREEAEGLVAAGQVVEFETVLAGKFRFWWKQGQCQRCDLRVISRKGVLEDARPRTTERQADLAVFSQGMATRATPGLRRENQ